MYQALYRKYRPKTFSEVVGQQHITDTLQRQVADGQVGHAYLFTGTRGTGKTTCARILAKAVNCEHPVDGAPCNQCAACRGIDDGSLLDVTELDAASNGSVNDARSLREEAIYPPSMLKKPLAGIRLLTDSILQTDHMDEETTKEFVTDIGREAERLSRITENLLRLTRLDSGVVQQPYPVAVAPVMERVERMLHMVAQEKGVTISGTADEDAVALATDDDVHQILYNLMENAIKYSAPENGFVHAEAHVDGQRVVITVSDNGIGIPDEDLPHIFDRFYRVDKMRSREVGGTGLGLSIVKDTIENRGGTIEAGHGADGVGTVFTVYLPLAERGDEV